jgi:hypothetical protein
MRFFVFFCFFFGVLFWSACDLGCDDGMRAVARAALENVALYRLRHTEQRSSSPTPSPTRCQQVPQFHRTRRPQSCSNPVFANACGACLFCILHFAFCWWVVQVLSVTTVTQDGPLAHSRAFDVVHMMWGYSLLFQAGGEELREISICSILVCDSQHPLLHIQTPVLQT